MRLLPNEKIVRRAAPNRHGILMTEMGGLFYIYDADHDEYDTEPTEFETREAADTAFDAEIRRLRDVPNWEAQAEYDEAHGTVNGYAPWQLIGREC